MSEGDSGVPVRPGNHLLRGSAWLIAMRWTMRLTGVISTIILARLLTPRDFGVVAIAMVVVGLFEMLSATGQGGAIIRHHDPSRQHYDAAWTVSVALGFAISIAIVLMAPLTRFYFHDDRSVLVMQCLALRAAMSGLENIGTVDFRRDLRFNRFFGYNLYAKLASFVITVTLAVLLRNYWALVAGILCGQFARTVLSYTMHSYRPRISFAKIPEIWLFSVWTFVRHIGAYFQAELDVIAVGGATGSVSMGRYTVAKDIASSPTDEIIGPMSSVLFPVMARCQHDPVQLRQLYLNMLGWAMIIGASTGIGIWLVAPDMVQLVLGDKWVSITPFVGWLAVTASVEKMHGGAFATLDVLGAAGVGAALQWFRVVALLMTIFPVAYLTRDLLDVVIVRFVVTALLVPPLLFVAGRRIGITARVYASVCWRPFAAASIMAAAVWLLNLGLPIGGTVRLGLDVFVGAMFYGGTLFVLWAASGRPSTAERDLLGLLVGIWARFSTIRARVLEMAR